MCVCVCVTQCMTDDGNNLSAELEHSRLFNLQFSRTLLTQPLCPLCYMSNWTYGSDNHLKVAGSILTTSENNRIINITVVSGHGWQNENNLPHK